MVAAATAFAASGEGDLPSNLPAFLRLDGQLFIAVERKVGEGNAGQPGATLRRLPLEFLLPAEQVDADVASHQAPEPNLPSFIPSPRPVHYPTGHRGRR